MNFDDNTKVLYTAGMHYIWCMGNSESLERYQQEQPDAKLITLKEASEAIEQAVKDAFLGKPATKITEEQWYEMLEVLPPCRWQSYGGIDAFHVSERITGDIVSWYARSDDVHATFDLLSTATSEEIVAKFNELEV